MDTNSDDDGGRPPNGRSVSASEVLPAETEFCDESTRLLRRHLSHGDVPRSHGRQTSLKRIHSAWIPRDENSQESPTIRRGIFLLLTEPNSSFASLTFFIILLAAITLSNILMVLQTMKYFQFTPTDCVTCGGDKAYVFEDDDSAALDSLLSYCVCPPAPKNFTVVLEDYLIYFFSIEWILRVVCYEPPPEERAMTWAGSAGQLFGYIFQTTTVLDFLAIFPYYMERFGSNAKGLVSLRLLRLFRVFQLVRLGQFNATFTILINVLSSSIPYLRLLLVVLVFGSAFFGSMMYWLEKGEWKYWEETQDFQFIRLAADGVSEEITPFTNVPQAFWWFMVTATTVGYGDFYPTSVGGKAIAVLAMLSGVLVIAFPVSVFSDLWQKELKEVGELDSPSSSISGDDYTIEVSVRDLQSIREHVKAVEDHQRAIHDILGRYDIK